MKPLRILAIDGGGIRGIIPAAILQSVQSKLPMPIYNYFDLIVGVSTGAILTYGLTAPRGDANAGNTPLISISDIIALYREKSKRIFDASMPAFLNFGATSAKYGYENIENVLQEIFKDTTISQSLSETITVSYCTEHRRPIFFKSRLAKKKQHRDIKIWQACRASAAAPVYFPPFRLIVAPKNSARIQFSLVDGGVCCNNPSMIGLIEASRLHPSRPIMLLSLGTGRVRKPILYGEINNGGIKDWGISAVDMLMSGPEDISSQAVSTLIANLGGSKMTRIQMDLPSDLEEMDKPDKAERIFQFATVFIKENRSIIDGIAMDINI